LYQFTRRAKTIVIILGYHYYQLHTKFYPTFSSRLSPYVNEIIGDHKCGFRRNRSTTDQILCIRQILEKKWEYNETVHEIEISLEVKREVIYEI
jgi:hypothetical protein